MVPHTENIMGNNMVLYFRCWCSWPSLDLVPGNGWLRLTTIPLSCLARRSQGRQPGATSKDVFGPISISTGSSKRSARSVLKAGHSWAKMRGRSTTLSLTKIKYAGRGRALPLVTEGEATVVSASISIAGGESEAEDQGDLEYTRPRVARPRPPFQRRPQPRFPWMLWRRGPAYARQQLSKRIENTGGKLEVFPGWTEG
ncbi:hypothetical protein Pcinc_014241 [Petrolisthes cinctipes]|uniref:Uncharacterized protein n=1 Tax=Petrolisthes cinctipes TaxID=88211 RepID=A0AAE1FXA8_PETCI|nr:hypothetical protein Pcinc_014241 [Petrolisthes cinctipes]